MDNYLIQAAKVVEAQVIFFYQQKFYKISFLNLKLANCFKVGQ